MKRREAWILSDRRGNDCWFTTRTPLVIVFQLRILVLCFSCTSEHTMRNGKPGEHTEHGLREDRFVQEKNYMKKNERRMNS